MKPSNSTSAQPTAWRRISHFLAETGLGRDAFLGACRSGDLPYQIRKIGHLYYARPRRSEPTFAARVYADRQNADRAPIDDTERHPTRAAEIYARARS